MKFQLDREVQFNKTNIKKKKLNLQKINYHKSGIVANGEQLGFTFFLFSRTFYKNNWLIQAAVYPFFFTIYFFSDQKSSTETHCSSSSVHIN